MVFVTATESKLGHSFIILICGISAYELKDSGQAFTMNTYILNDKLLVEI